MSEANIAKVTASTGIDGKTHLWRETWEGTNVHSGLGTVKQDGHYSPPELKDLVEQLKAQGASVSPFAQAALNLAHTPGE